MPIWCLILTMSHCGIQHPVMNSLTIPLIVGKGIICPPLEYGIIQSHRVMASSLMERAIRSNGSEIPTLSSVVEDFMKQLTFTKKASNLMRQYQLLQRYENCIRVETSADNPEYYLPAARRNGIKRMLSELPSFWQVPLTLGICSSLRPKHNYIPVPKRTWRSFSRVWFVRG